MGLLSRVKLGMHDAKEELHRVKQQYGGPSQPSTAVPAGYQGPVYSNPVINKDFPDPNCLLVGDQYYAFATNHGHNVQCAVSKDLVSWQVLPDAMPELPPWVQPGLTWAPNVTHVQLPDRQYFVLYFVARDRHCDKQTIGFATSQHPAGPYKCVMDRPMVAQVEQGGSIDPFLFTDDDGSRWLIYKNDGNAVGQPTTLYIQPLTPDGLNFAGPPTALFSNDQPWEGGVVEAPCLWKHNNKYYMFYSGNGYGGAEYAIGYATAHRVTGPYQKRGKPMVRSHGMVVGPGACCIVRKPTGCECMLFHSWEPAHRYRATNLACLTWQQDEPVVQATWAVPCPCPM